jgi:hypothetical protein
MPSDHGFETEEKRKRRERKEEEYARKRAEREFWERKGRERADGGARLLREGIVQDVLED